MLRSRKFAEEADISVEVLLVADCPDNATETYLHTAKSLGVKTIVTDVDDLGLARNVAVESTDCDFVAFLDGDDLWSPRWLAAAFVAAVKETRNIVWHPEASFIFGEGTDPHWMIHPDMDDDPEIWLTLGLRNLWTSLVFGPREIFLQVPYKKTNLGLGIGFEDWSWNCEVVAHDSIHKIVRGTAHLIRRNPGSLSQRTSSSRALPGPTELFRQRLDQATNLCRAF
jgi:glycosyltransferase involved in cell wall biosynthesis